MAGERVQRHVGHHAQIGELLFQRPHRRVAPGRRVQGFPLPSGVFERLVDDREQCHDRDASLTQSSATGSSRSRLRRSTPGMEATGTRWLAVDHEHQDKSGRASVSCVFSRTRLRVKVSRRRRRGRPGVGATTDHAAKLCLKRRLGVPSLLACAVGCRAVIRKIMSSAFLLHRA